MSDAKYRSLSELCPVIEVQLGPDLSRCHLDVLQTILLHVPTKDLILNCSRVCTTWHKLLSLRSFWFAKEDLDGSDYLRELLSNGYTFHRDLLNYAVLSLKKPFNRNILTDSNPFGDAVTKHCDPRWHFVWKSQFRYVSPPSFKMNHFAHDFESLFDGCFELGSMNGSRIFGSSFKQLGVSDEILDAYRPPITFTEYVAHRTGNNANYFMRVELSDSHGAVIESQQESIHFPRWHLQKWLQCSITFKAYPAGVRRIVIQSGGNDEDYGSGHCGPKIAGSSLVIGFETTIHTC